MDDTELAREVLRDEIRDHDAGRCSCTYPVDDPGAGPCVAADWLNHRISDQDIIKETPSARIAYLRLSEDDIVALRNEEKRKLDAVLAAFTEQMKERLYQKVDEGYIGWDTAEGWLPYGPLHRLYLESQRVCLDEMNVDKRLRKLVDTANFALFSWLHCGNGDESAASLLDLAGIESGADEPW